MVCDGRRHRRYKIQITFEFVFCIIIIFQPSRIIDAYLNYTPPPDITINEIIEIIILLQ